MIGTKNTKWDQICCLSLTFNAFNWRYKNYSTQPFHQLNWLTILIERLLDDDGVVDDYDGDEHVQEHDDDEEEGGGEGQEERRVPRREK